LSLRELIQWGLLPSQYVDDEGDKVLLATDNDLMGAVNFARMCGSKVSLHVQLVLLVFSQEFQGILFKNLKSDCHSLLKYNFFGGIQPLTLHIEESTGITRTKCRFPAPTNSQGGIQVDGWTLGHSLLVAGAVTAITISVVMLLRRSNA
jgi:hypothetical protein